MYYIEHLDEWLKCKHQNGTSVRGVACDCTGLVTGIYAEKGINITVNLNYGAFWYMKKGCEELLLPYLEKYCNKVDELQEGDCISYKFGRSKYAHLSIYLGDGKIIHCNADFGVEIINKGELADRETGFWRLKDGFIQKD